MIPAPGAGRRLRGLLAPFVDRAAATPGADRYRKHFPLRAHPDVVPELVTGGSVAELLASVEPARAAYARIVETRPAVVEETVVVPVVPPVVPAGSGTSAVDPATLPAQELIRRGIEAERRKGGKAARQG